MKNDFQFELSLSVVFKYPLPKCGPGAADDQIEQLVNNVCDCCGCIDNPVCREAQRSLLGKQYILFTFINTFSNVTFKTRKNSEKMNMNTFIELLKDSLLSKIATEKWIQIEKMCRGYILQFKFNQKS